MPSLNPLRVASLVTSWPGESTTPLYPKVDAWSGDTQLGQIVLDDVLGDVIASDALLTRSAAMSVPAVARARHLTCGTIAGLPLVVLTGSTAITDQPSWAYATDGQVGDLTPSLRALLGLYVPQSPQSRMLWTIDDCLFYGWSLWLRTRNTVPAAGSRRTFPLRMVRIPYDRWEISERGEVVDVDGHPLPADDLVLIPGPHEGILTFGRRTIRAAGSLERTAADVAKHPWRLELHQVTDADVSDDERRALIKSARDAMADNEGILWTNAAVETKDHPRAAEDLLISGRNAAALDIARHVSMPAAMLDATSVGASLEYSNTVARNQQWIDQGLSLYADAIAARLSMDDVVPQGQRVAFDMSELTAPTSSPTGAPRQD